MIPFLMVPATRDPAKTAPRNSNTAAAQQACLRVRDLELTEVAKELCWDGVGQVSGGVG